MHTSNILGKKDYFLIIFIICSSYQFWTKSQNKLISWEEFITRISHTVYPEKKLSYPYFACILKKNNGMNVFEMYDLVALPFYYMK